MSTDAATDPPDGSDDLFAATPGLRWFLTGAGVLGVGLGALDAAVNGASVVAGAAVAFSAGLAWTAWRARLPTRYRVGWLAWLVAAGVALAWPGRPGLVLPALAGLGLGGLPATRAAIRRRDAAGPEG